MQRGKYSRLPIDERAVAVKTQQAELREIQHERTGEQKRAQGLGPGLWFLSNEWLSHFDRLLQLEAHRGFGRQNNVLVAGESGAACACATASQRTDTGALTAASQSANQGSQCRTASGQNGCA